MIKKNIATPAFMNLEQAKKDSDYLASCQMCIYAALKIGAKCAEDILYIIEKYNSKAPRLKVVIGNIFQFAKNSSEGLAKLSDHGGIVDKSRETATALSAANFISLYMTAVTIQPEQMTDFIRELDVLGQTYLKKPTAETFNFLVWLTNDGWEIGKTKITKKGNLFHLVIVLETLQVFKKGIETPVFQGCIPSLEHEAETMFKLLAI